MSIHCRSAVAHQVRQGKQCGLNLSEVPVLKQVVGLKDVVGLHAVGQDAFDEVPEVLQLQGEGAGRRRERRMWMSVCVVGTGESQLSEGLECNTASVT